MIPASERYIMRELQFVTELREVNEINCFKHVEYATCQPIVHPAIDAITDPVKTIVIIDIFSHNTARIEFL